MKPACILVVDDEPSLRILLSRIFVKEGFKVLASANGGEGLETAFKERPDLVILDLNLPDMNGEEVCQKIRQDPAIGTTPVLILTGKTTEGLSARCLNRGADAYLSKPFDVDDILAHVRALLRRANSGVSGQEVLSKGRITIRTGERRVFWKGRRVEALAPKEFDLLCHLVSHAPKVLDKKALALRAWGVPLEQLHVRTLDVHIRRIRRKLGPAAAGCLKTVPSVGFQWIEESELSPLDPSSVR